MGVNCKRFRRRELGLGAILAALSAVFSVAVASQPHVHGVAQLNIIADQNLLMVELRSPADNLVGFEHKATTAAQNKRVEIAIKTLADASAQFRINGVQCKLVDYQSDIGKLTLDDHDHDHDHDHDQQNAGSQHHHEEHEHEHEHGEGGHADITVSYQFTCDQIAAVQSIDVLLISSFPAMESLNVQWVAYGQQGAVILNHSEQRVSLK